MSKRSRIFTGVWVLLCLAIGPTRTPSSGQDIRTRDAPHVDSERNLVTAGTVGQGTADPEFMAPRSPESPLRVRVGRQQWGQLAAVGTVEGLGGELPLRHGLRLGAIVGFKPDETDPDVAIVEETLAAAYLSAGAGEEKSLYHRSTIGVMGRLCEGELDRLALLLNQETDLGSRLRLLTASEIDVPALTSDLDQPLHVSSLDLTAVSPITSLLTLRFGAEHDCQFKEPGEDVAGSHESAWSLDHGTWRYWGGARQHLFWGFEADAELEQLTKAGCEDLRYRARLSRRDFWGFEVNAEVEQLTKAGDENDYLSWRAKLSRGDLCGFQLDAEFARPSTPGYEDGYVSWRAKLSRRNLPSLGDSRIAATVTKPGPAEVYDGRLFAHVPLFDSPLSLRPDLKCCYSAEAPSDGEFQLTEITLATGQEQSEILDLQASFSYSFVELGTRVVVDLEFQYTW